MSRRRRPSSVRAVMNNNRIGFPTAPMTDTARRAKSGNWPGSEVPLKPGSSLAHQAIPKTLPLARVPGPSRGEGLSGAGTCVSESAGFFGEASGRVFWPFLRLVPTMSRRGALATCLRNIIYISDFYPKSALCRHRRIRKPADVSAFGSRIAGGPCSVEVHACDDIPDRGDDEESAHGFPTRSPFTIDGNR